MKTKTVETVSSVRFACESGTLCVSDPCYVNGPDVSFGGNGLNAAVMDAAGDWTATVETSDEGDWGRRVASLMAVRAGVTIARHSTGAGVYVAGEHIPWVERAAVAVDSGQMWIGDAANLPLDYVSVCQVSLAREFGAADGGAVSSTGYGDGIYRLEVAALRGAAVGVRVTFIGRESDES